MENKIKYIIIAIIAIVIVGGILAFTIGANMSTQSKTTVELYNNDQNSISSKINEIESPQSPYKDMVDNKTVEWLKSLDDSYVVLDGLNGFYVMKREEANKIPNDNDTSIMTLVVIKGVVKETHNLGSGLPDYTLLDNVEFVNRKQI